MGQTKKIQPRKLAEKLLAVRKRLGLSQREMVEAVVPDNLDARSLRSLISNFESGHRTPSLIEVYNYAKAVSARTEYKDFNSDYLIDDDRSLPWLSDSENRESSV